MKLKTLIIIFLYWTTTNFSHSNSLTGEEYLQNILNNLIEITKENHLDTPNCENLVPQNDSIEYLIYQQIQTINKILNDPEINLGKIFPILSKIPQDCEFILQNLEISSKFLSYDENNIDFLTHLFAQTKLLQINLSKLFLEAFASSIGQLLQRASEIIGPFTLQNIEIYYHADFLINHSLRVSYPIITRTNHTLYKLLVHDLDIASRIQKISGKDLTIFTEFANNILEHILTITKITTNSGTRFVLYDLSIGINTLTNHYLHIFEQQPLNQCDE